jgi:hypothetical protein
MIVVALFLSKRFNDIFELMLSAIRPDINPSWGAFKDTEEIPFLATSKLSRYFLSSTNI